MPLTCKFCDDLALWIVHVKQGPCEPQPVCPAHVADALSIYTLNLVTAVEVPELA